MKLYLFTILAAALPALAAPTCNAGQVVEGNNCTLTGSLGWAIAGLGTDSVYMEYVPPSATGPVSIYVTGLTSSLGSAYTGYLGLKISDLDGTNVVGPFTLADIIAAGPDVLDPGSIETILVTQVCWDPTCTSAPPAGAIPNMFSLQVKVSSPNTADVNLNFVIGTVRFLSNGRVTFEIPEAPLRANAPYSIIPGINLGARPEGRYTMTGTAVNLPYDVVSISNLNNPNSITGTATIKDLHGATIATAPIAAIPPGGATGYLVIGRTPGDTLGLFPSSLVLPAGSDGVFHGILEIGMNGLTPNGQCIVLAQEFNGNAMLNQVVFRSSVP